MLAVYHSDFSPVTAEKPARTGETLVLRATGLGPLTPGTTPSGSTPFPNPPVEVNSPVEVAVGDVPGQVVSKVGWPGETNTYRVDFVVPSGLPPGTAGVRLTAAWIPGGAFPLPVAN